MPMTDREKLMAGILVAVIVIAAVAVALVAQRNIKSTGRIKSVGGETWADENRTIVLREIDWGDFSPGDVKGVVFWAQNTGKINVTLSFNTTAWEPTNAADYILYSWNYTGRVLPPGNIEPIALQCMASASITGITSFANDITVYFTET